MRVDPEHSPGSLSVGEGDRDSVDGAGAGRPAAPTHAGRLTWVALVGLAWGQSSLLVGTISSPAPASVAQAGAIEASGLLTVVYVLALRTWVPRLLAHPRRNAGLLGIVNAAFVETIFWACQAVFGADGVAAQPNLLVDLGLRLPWYAGLVVLFVRAHDRWRLSISAVLLLGGLYAAGADWLLGEILLGGAPVGPALSNLVVIYFWQFVVVYSSIVLPPALLVSASPVPERGMGSRWADAVIPLGWLLPYAMYLVVALSLLASTGAG